MSNQGIERIIKMLKIADSKDAVFPPTDLYNEGWMLRILLSLQADGVDCLPFSFHPKSKWFSEALLSSPFLPRYRGDALAEGHTHSDGVVGHFNFQPGTKTGLTLESDAKQFVVIEAKMFSRLSKGIKNAKNYDQAARTVACIAWTIYQSSRVIEDLESLDFYVFAPQEQIAAGLFSAQMEKSSISKKVTRRINSYEKEGEIYEELRKWYDGYFLPTLEHLNIGCITWESIIGNIDDESIHKFYNNCLKFNAKK